MLCSYCKNNLNECHFKRPKDCECIICASCLNDIKRNLEKCPFCSKVYQHLQQNHQDINLNNNRVINNRRNELDRFRSFHSFVNQAYKLKERTIRDKGLKQKISILNSLGVKELYDYEISTLKRFYASLPSIKKNFFQGLYNMLECNIRNNKSVSLGGKNLAYKSVTRNINFKLLKETTKDFRITAYGVILPDSHFFNGKVTKVNLKVGAHIVHTENFENLIPDFYFPSVEITLRPGLLIDSSIRELEFEFIISEGNFILIVHDDYFTDCEGNLMLKTPNDGDTSMLAYIKYIYTT